MTNDVRNFARGPGWGVRAYILRAPYFCGRNHEIRAAAVRRPRTTPLDYRVGVTLGPHLVRTAHTALAVSTFSLSTAFGCGARLGGADCNVFRVSSP